MRSASIAALAVLSYATQSVADEQLRPKYYFPKDVKRHNTPDLLSDVGDVLGGDKKTTVATSTSTSSDQSDTVVVPIYVYVGEDGKTSTTTGQASTKTAAGTIHAKPLPTTVKADATTEAKSATKTEIATPEKSTSSDDGGFLGLGGLGNDVSSLLLGTGGQTPTTILQPTTATATATASATSHSSSFDPFGWLSPSSSSSVGAPTSTGLPGITVGLSSVYLSTTSPSQTQTASGSATETSASASSSNPGLLPSLSIPPIIPIPSTTTKPSSVAIPTTTKSSHPSVGPTGTTSTGATTTASSATIKPSGSASVQPTTKTGSASVTPSQPAIPSQSTSASVSPSGSSQPVTTKPSVSPSQPASPSVTHVTTKPSEPSTTAEPTTTTHSSASDTPYVPPPVITPTVTSTGPTGPEPTAPTQIPEVILPPGGTPQAPENSTLVQFGFNKDLSWPTVATSMNWPDQIYYYTPIGVSYALATPQDKVTPFWLGPYDTASSLGYNTTLIKFYIPEDLVSTLQAQRLAPASDLYQQPNTPNDKPTFDQSSIKNLFSMLNRDIPLVAQQPTGGANPGSDNGSGNGSNGGNGNTNNGDAGASASSGVRPSSIGIGVGAAAGAAAYAGAMFYVARRYRKRKQLHQRSSSVPSASMSEVSNSGFLSGPNRISHNSGRSNRTAQISAPVMSENSLGWN